MKNNTAETLSIHPSLNYKEFKNFEEIFHSAYSHGLEAIYTLENVDLKTVRRLGESPLKPDLEPTENKTAFPTLENKEQLEFAFGESFSETIHSFVLEEPIQVLGLSKYAEKCLSDQNLLNLYDLIKVDKKELVFKGLGQGHIDEMQNKLTRYILGRDLFHCPYIDFAAWIRSLFASFSHKKIFVALELFQLENLLPLSPTENIEIRKLTLEKRLEWREEAHLWISTQKRKVLEGIDKVIKIFIKPWIERRLGFATYEEIVERFQRIGFPANIVHNVVSFFSETYFEGDFPVKHYLKTSSDLFFSTSETHENYLSVLECAKSYFSSHSASYQLSELVILISREFAKEWKGFPEGYVEKVLRYSPFFYISKEKAPFSKKSRLIVRQA